MIGSHETDRSKHTLSPDNGLGEWIRAGNYVCLILWLMKGTLTPTILLYLTERFIFMFVISSSIYFVATDHYSRTN